MKDKFSEHAYGEMLEKLFVRFPSFQKDGSAAFKPGIANMQFADQLMGHPHRKYDVIHVAGTNGKGSVSNMLSSVLSASGMKVGLYTSPHILDFRERMRVHDGSLTYVPKEYVWDFIDAWGETFDHLDLSFFEITTLLAMKWFADCKVDVVVLETGLGGRLDSTNVVSPILSVITNIGLDHCDMLGETLPEIAFEKAGIIKPKVPVVVGESSPETDPVFERKVLYTNLPEPEYMGDRTAMAGLLTYADKTCPELWDRHGSLLEEMDLQGEYQRKNLRTVLVALEVLCRRYPDKFRMEAGTVCDAIVHTARRMEFHGRWEKVSDSPFTICDIGHNEHGLRHNFAQLARMRAEGACTGLIIVYGSVADKDVDAVMHLFPEDAVYVFTQARSRRALDAEIIRTRFEDHCAENGRHVPEIHCCGTVSAAVELARTIAGRMVSENAAASPLIYIGGSTYVVSEAVAII